MKKILSILLIIAMMLSFVSCDIFGGQTGGENNGSDGGGNTNGGNNNNGGSTENPDVPDPDSPKPEDPKPDIDPDPNTVTVYLLNRAGWEKVALYYWNRDGEVEGGWPGAELSVGEDGLYRGTFDKAYTNLIFNNNHNGAQTADLYVPNGDNIVYDNVDNRWITYSEALAFVDADNTDTPTPSPDSVTVYLINRAGWDEVAIYCWNWGAMVDTEGGWPGEKLSVGEDGLYMATVDSKFVNLVFNDNGNGSQTVDLTLPVGDRIVYDNLYNFWITYSEAINILNSDGEDVEPDTPHEHDYVSGKCECGAEDPNYVPPHEHDYVSGKCECGAEDPNYVPPHEHNYVSGKCECGAEDPNYVPPHEHNYVSGKCECGAEDPNYVPDDFHEHSYVSGKCECGAEDPNYVPPHEHDYVSGKCECGAEDPNYVPPHEHNYVSGKCECGAEDPNYVPPHEHSYVNGKCECGAEDPNYVPPHEHSYVNGKCECGAEDPSYSPDIPDSPEVDDELALFYELFDHNNHVSFKLDISNSELKKIQKDYEKYSSKGSKSPIYRMANLIVTITKPDGTVMKYTIEQVGVRMKGNTSRTSFYSDSDGMYNLVHFKISFQETFDDAAYYGTDALTWTDSAARKERKNRTFATLEKIDIRWNRNDDTTYIRESYAYDLYREFGVLAPHTNLASVDIGNDHAGVWVIYEPVDKIFLEKNLPAEALGGDLYKLGWTSKGATFTSFSSYGVEDEDACKFYTYDLKTNKKTSTHQSLRNLINMLNSGGLTKDGFASVVDVENFMYYCAVSYIIGNCDDLRYNYNNSYIYFRADTGKMIVIPYDMDRGLGVNTWNPSGNGMTTVDPFSKWNACGNQESPLFLKSVCSGGLFVNEYIEKLKEVDGSEMLTNAKFKEAYDTAASLYSGQATPSKSYKNAGGYKFRFDINRTCNPGDSKNMSFADYISQKRVTLYQYIGDQGNNEGSSGGSGDSGDSGGGSYDPITNAQPYVMGDMNNWQTNSQYEMKSNGDGTFTFTLTSSHVSSSYGRIKFKIFDANNNMWYGYEIVDPGCTVNYNDITGNANGNKNFYLAPGTYVLTFDANTVKLYIEKK